MKRNEGFMLQNVGGESVLVPLRQKVMDLNGLITLNDTGRLVWELLAQDRTADDLAEAVAERFEVDRERARADIQIFLDEIAPLGLLEQ